MGRFVESRTIRGWGVLQPAPWHFVGVFASKADADAKALAMGPSYAVHWGDNQEATDNFILSDVSKSDRRSVH